MRFTESWKRRSDARRLVRVVLTFSACLACGAPAPERRVVLGTGSEGYEAIAADGFVPLISGIQGGFHVWTSFLAYGFETDVVRMDLSTRFEGEELSRIDMGGNVALRPTTDGGGNDALGIWGWPASVSEPRCANDKTLIVEVEISDDAGHHAMDTRSCKVSVAQEYRRPDCDG